MKSNFKTSITRSRSGHYTVTVSEKGSIVFKASKLSNVHEARRQLDKYKMTRDIKSGVI